MDMQSVTQKLAAQSITIRQMTFALGIFDMVALGDKSFVVAQVEAAGYEIIQTPPPAEKQTDQGTITVLQFKLPAQQNMVDSYMTVIRRIDGAAHVQQGKIISISNLIEDRVFLAFKDGKTAWYDLSAAITPEPHESLYSVESQYGVRLGDDWLQARWDWIQEENEIAQWVSKTNGLALKVEQEEIASLSSPNGLQPIDLGDYVAAVFPNDGRVGWEDDAPPLGYIWRTEYGTVDVMYFYTDNGLPEIITFYMDINHRLLTDNGVYVWIYKDGVLNNDKTPGEIAFALHYFTEHPDHFVDGHDVTQAIRNFEYEIADIIIKRLEAKLEETKRGTIVPARGAGQIVSSIDVIYKGQSGVMETRFIPKSSPSRTFIRDVIPVSQTVYTPELDLVPSGSEGMSFTEAMGLLQEGKLTADEVAKIGNAEARNNFVSSMMSRRAVQHD